MTEFNVGDRVRDDDGDTGFVVRVPDEGDDLCWVHYDGWVAGTPAGTAEYLTLLDDCEDAPDMVNKPAHYSAGMPEGIEVIDIIRSQGWEDNYNLGNATKYLLRCEHKGTKKQDLEKLLVYVQWELNRL